MRRGFWLRFAEVLLRPPLMAFTVPLVGTVLRSSGQIPVHRATRDAGDALRTAAARIRAGEAPLIYPEGTVIRDPDLWPMQGKTGVARLSLDTGAQVRGVPAPSGPLFVPMAQKPHGLAS